MEGEGIKLEMLRSINEQMKANQIIKDEIIRQLLNEQKNDDIESAHGFADALLCEFLESLGHKDVVDAYEAIDKWYA